MTGTVRALLEGLALFACAMALMFGLYVAFVAGGAFLHTAGDGEPHTRTVHLFASPVHAEIVVPIKDDVADWRPLATAGGLRGTPADHEALAEASSHVSIGWGADGFYPNVRRLSDLRAGQVLDGLWDDSVLHVSFLKDPESIPGVMTLELSETGYNRLVDDLEDAFARPEGAYEPLPGEGYGWNDAFFRAVGDYSPLHTCNEWIAERLRAAGVAVGRFTPFAQTLMFSLRNAQQDGE